MKKTLLKTTVFSAILMAILILGACSEPKPSVSFDSLEEAKGTARDNAIWNAQTYRQENVLYSGWSIIVRGDSTQNNSCPQGDGWATMDFVSPSKLQKIKVKCSTVSANTGCLEDSDFKTKSYSSEDGHCQSTNKVPYPLPKIAK